MNEQEWLKGLESFVQAKREENPIPDSDSLCAEDEWNYRIIGGSLIAFYKQRLTGILKERLVLRMMSFSSDPLVVFTTSMPGLMAAREIEQDILGKFVYLLHSDFREWEDQNPVDTFTSHIRCWNHFRGIDQNLLAKATAAYPSVDPNEFRIHIQGDLWGEQCGLFVEHLWRWDGDEMKLLEEAISHGVY
jgi:hypothetical protein